MTYGVKQIQVREDLRCTKFNPTKKIMSITLNDRDKNPDYYDNYQLN